MVGRRRLMVIFAGATMASMVLYFIFRLSVLSASFAAAISIWDYVIITLFWLGEAFIVFHGLGYIASVIASVRRYDREEIVYPISNFPHVDIAIPIHDEPQGIVLRTLTACKYIDYPNFSVTLVDGSDKPENQKAYQRMCRAHGIVYFNVPRPRHGAKAGALNEFLHRKVRAKYLAVFDADFRPSRDFLKSLVPQLEMHHEVAFVQTPQFYGNIDQTVVARAAELQQSIFYEYISEAKSVRGGQFLCGTNFVIRSGALRGVGGFDETSITEDFATSLKLIRAGWVGRYYNYTAAFGDGPINLREYFRQQYRWARGTLGLFFERFPAFFCDKNVSWWQRWEFLLSGSYYIVGLCWFILVLLPPVYIFFRLPVYVAQPSAYLLAYTPYAVLSLFLFVQTLLGRRYRVVDWLRAESLALLAVPVYAKAAVDTLLRRPAVFEKTRKHARAWEIPYEVMGAQIFLVCANVIAVVFGLWYIVTEGATSALAINVFWAAFHGFLLVYLILQIYGTRHQSKT